MKRFVTYIYQYSRGIRGKNVGFIKTDIRDSGCRMEIHIRGLERFQGHAQIYLIVSGENMGIPSGVIPIGQGIGHITLNFAHNLLGDSGYTIHQVQVIVIRYGGGQLLASCWSDHVPAEILLGQFDIYSGAPEKADNPTPPPASNDSGKRIVPIQLRPENGASAHTIRLDSGLPSGVAPAPDLRSGSEPRTDADADSVARSDSGENPDSGSHAVTAATSDSVSANDSGFGVDSDSVSSSDSGRNSDSGTPAVTAAPDSSSATGSGSGADSDSISSSDSRANPSSGSYAATAATDSNSAINSGLGVDSDSISSSDSGANSGSGSYAVTAATPDSGSANDSGFGVDSDSVSSSDSGRNSDSGTPAAAANPNSSSATDSGFGLDSDSVARSDAGVNSDSGSSAMTAASDTSLTIDSGSGTDSDSVAMVRSHPDSSPADDSGDRTSENLASTPDACQKSNVDSTSENPALPPKITYQKIEITDIRKLPKKNWYLCNNSFLIHGFFNYHHLMLKTIETDGQKKCYLGVPGIYEQPERMMALLFGFPEFEPARNQTDPHGTDLTADTPVSAAAQYPDDKSTADTPPSNTASNKQESDIPSPSTGVFGYWMCTCHVSPE